MSEGFCGSEFIANDRQGGRGGDGKSDDARFSRDGGGDGGGGSKGGDYLSGGGGNESGGSGGHERQRAALKPPKVEHMTLLLGRRRLVGTDARQSWMCPQVMAKTEVLYRGREERGMLPGSRINSLTRQARRFAGEMLVERRSR